MSERDLPLANGSAPVRRVHVELQRVQHWLFEVPRLRAMVGANVLLGETLRVELPKLARQTGRWSLAPGAEAYPAADPDDPLKEHDDPSADARFGILSRDGGHFDAWFTSGAEIFVREAAALVRRALPGLRVRVSIDGKPEPGSRVMLPDELPVLAPCQWTGRGLASAIVEQGDERAAVSLGVERRHEAARRAENGAAKDLASLLSAKTRLGELGRPQDLGNLAGSGYLALIHADGNGVGSAAAQNDVERARFFHRNRVLLRRAAQRAIDKACDDEAQAPLIPLMLGGDDLLVVSRADKALPFVATLCDELAELQAENRNGFELTLGVGVVIAKRSIPMNRLHEAVEQLASSAKRRFRGFKPEERRRSVVDWAVFTSSWVHDPEEVRRRDWLRGNGPDARVLSQRPVDVIGEGLGCLQGLVGGAEKLKGAPRSQLRYLVDELPRGRALSELAFKELSKEARSALTDAGVTAAWRQSASDGPWMTALLDLVEVSEISRLGRSNGAPESSREAAHV